MTNVKKNSFVEIESSISIDSFRISIPIKYVTILDQNLTDKVTTYTINNNTQEVLSEKEVKENSIIKEFNHVPYRFNIDNSFGETKVVVLINSKHLGSDYFNGITKDNIKAVYHNIIACNIIEVNYDVFLQQPIVDTDFKKDHVIDLETYKKSLSIVRDCSKLSKYKDDGCKPFTNGIEFSNRKTEKYLSNPFFKIYHKEIELKENSAAFTNRFLTGIDFKNKVRFEFTVKNKKHFRSFGIENNKLITILSLSNEVKTNILHSVVKKHLSKRENIKPMKTTGLNPSHQIIYDYTNLLLNNGLTIDGAINYILTSFKGVTKHRKRKEIEFVYENYIQGTIAEKRSINLNSFFNSLGWN